MKSTPPYECCPFDCRQDHDDEEELQTAALEKLRRHPHGSRMAVLPLGSKKIDMELIDVRHLNKQARQAVLRRAMEVNEQDNERLLSKVKQRQDRCCCQALIDLFSESCLTTRCCFACSRRFLHTAACEPTCMKAASRPWSAAPLSSQLVRCSRTLVQ